MNLYRSFGNLMETYVCEDQAHPDSQSEQDNADGPHAPVSNREINPRSESVDSGVETASCETSYPRTLPTESTEVDLFLPQRDRFSPTSTSKSPVVLSSLPSSVSSSPNLCPSRAEEDPTTLTLEGEPELQRTDSKRWKQVYGVLKQQPKASSLPRQQASEFKKFIKSASFNGRRRFDPSSPAGQTSVKQISQGSGVFDGKELSPGLYYLELVCQKMEQYAQQQMQNQALQTETDDLQGQEEQKNDSADAENQQIPSEPKQQKSRHFRQRSASDTTLSKLHLKKFSLNSRGQQRSTNDLREIEEEDDTQMDSVKEESNKKSILQRLKLGSLRRAGSSVTEIRSQQMQSSEKTSARRRFSQLFRRSKKVSPN